MLAVVVVTALGGCASDERQWMKLDANYTREDFQRDWAACTRNGKVDDACMRNLGWVAVNPGGSIERPKDPHARDLAPPSARGDRRY